MSGVPELRNEKRVSEILGVAVATLRQWRIRGTGPDYVKLGRRVLYRMEDVSRWIDERVCHVSRSAPDAATR